MNLVEVHKITKNHKDYKELDNLCFLSKNLYNATLYTIRQYYFKYNEYLNYNIINKSFAYDNHPDYRALPAKVSKWVQKLVDQDMQSFFALVKKAKVGLYTKKVRLPRYADKVKGRKKLHYEKGALSFKKKKGYINLSKTGIYIKSKLSENEVSYVEVVPCNGCIKLIVGYEKDRKEYKFNSRFASIDLGVNNLAVVSSPVMNPFIINGRPLKSINQYANKKIAHLKSKLPKGEYSSRRIQSILLKRENKIEDYLHKASIYIVNQLVSNHITVLVIGYNEGWKQDITMGKKNNQNFMHIPFLKFIDMLEYKCRLNGIMIVLQEESYTSKCSFLDNEDVGKHEIYLGKRVKRGLFITNNGVLINADLNASLNILRKCLAEKGVWNHQFWLDQIEASSVPNLCKITFV